MKLPFLYEEVKKSNIDEKEKILKALVTQEWKITSIHELEELKVDLESDEGYWLNIVPLDLFPREVLAKELIKYQPCFE